MNLTRTPTTTLYGSVAFGGSMSTPEIKAHLESMLDSDHTATESVDTPRRTSFTDSNSHRRDGFDGNRLVK
ncbi:hypothetical protein [Rhodococcus sp. JVH1]|uniref:hypothetical protein n=1 Tax=Rhodococcus sp. JVH1 TaxID=745408 RepID=UPI0002720887|nr:hypothetical protein [Rhodococcus sp. JVH1]EJI98313.1 hypothetical protein JVH1_4181 [Rhodococcus sp. JVH1]